MLGTVVNGLSHKDSKRKDDQSDNKLISNVVNKFDFNRSSCSILNSWPIKDSDKAVILLYLKHHKGTI